jgi:hypothetical protein
LDTDEEEEPTPEPEPEPKPVPEPDSGHRGGALPCPDVAEKDRDSETNSHTDKEAGAKVGAKSHTDRDTDEERGAVSCRRMHQQKRPHCDSLVRGTERQLPPDTDETDEESTFFNFSN